MGVAIRWIRESLHRLRGIPHVGIPQKRRREPHAVFYFELLALAHTHTHSHTGTGTHWARLRFQVGIVTAGGRKTKDERTEDGNESDET